MASVDPPNSFGADDDDEEDGDDEDYNPSIYSGSDSEGTVLLHHQVMAASIARALEAARRYAIASTPSVMDAEEGGNSRHEVGEGEEDEAVVVIEEDEEAVVVIEDEEEDGNGLGGGDAQEIGGLSMAKYEESDPSLFSICPVCMEIWRAEGPHRICCIPCGHVYGRSCLEKWLDRCGKKTAKCPQCNRKFRQKEIINLYAPQIAVPNDDVEKELHSLREKNESLQLEKARLLEELQKQKKHSMERDFYAIPKMACVEHASSGLKRRPFDYYDDSARSPFGNSHDSQSSSGNRIRGCSFLLQNELPVNSARVMAIDASSHIVLVAEKDPRLEREHVLSKISLVSSSEADKILLPADTRAIRDICILPNRLILLASLGKKLLLLSTESNNIVLKYDLPAPVWSCSGDYNSPYHIYAGLQNGTLMVFDIRQTAAPIYAAEGPTRQPIHTIHSVVHSGTRKVLSGSSAGPCMWDIDHNALSPSLIPGVENQGVCISVASNSSVPDVVASFRPKVEASSNENLSSQACLSPSPVIPGSGRLASHVLLKRADMFSYQRHHPMGYSHISEHRMTKSAIFSTDEDAPMFAIGDELSRRVRIWDLPNFQDFTDMKPHNNPILDLRCERAASGPCFLGCISEDKLQVYRQCSRL